MSRCGAANARAWRITPPKCCNLGTAAQNLRGTARSKHSDVLFADEVSLRIFLPLMIGFGVVLGAAPARAAGSNDLPDIGSPATAAISLADEYQLGRMVVRGLRDQGTILEDPEVSEYLQSLGLRLSSGANDGTYQFQFFIDRGLDINAFALPGGFVGVNAGLLLATRNENELAGVMAHEITHVTQRHIARTLVAQSRNSLVSTAAMLAAILVGAAAGGDAAMAGIAAAQSLALQQQVTFSRSNEFEADSIGIGLMANAGFDPNGMWSFFETIQRQSGAAEAQLPAILRTHPVTTDRIAETRARAAGATSQRLYKDSLAYELTKERLRVLLTPRGQDPRTYYAGTLVKEMGNTPAVQYGKGLALMNTGAPKEALPIFSKLLAADSTVMQYHTALGLAQLQAGSRGDALATFEKASRLFPRNVAVTVRYAEALMQAGQAKRAHEVLLDLFNNVPPTPEQAKLIALAASSAGDVADAYSYMAEYHIMGGDLQLAVSQLQLALSVPSITGVQRARYQARLEEILRAMPRRAFTQGGAPQEGGRGPGR